MTTLAFMGRTTEKRKFIGGKKGGKQYPDELTPSKQQHRGEGLNTPQGVEFRDGKWKRSVLKILGGYAKQS